MSDKPRSMGHPGAQTYLLAAIASVDNLIRIDEFPNHKADMEQVLNKLRAFHGMHRRDFVAGLHHDEAEPFILSRWIPDLSPAVPCGNAKLPPEIDHTDYAELVEFGGDLARPR